MLYQNRLFHPLLLAALLCGTAAIPMLAQGPEGPGPGGRHGGHHGPPPSNPLFEALDTNHDGVLSAEEIANASASLKSLLKNGATQLTREDLRPTPPAAHTPSEEEATPAADEMAHPRPPAVREHQPPRPPEAQAAPDGFGRVSGPHPDAGPAFPHGPRGEDAARHHGPPPNLIFDALDANHDGVLSEEEISNASTALKGLLKKGTTELRREDLRPGGPPEHWER